MSAYNLGYIDGYYGYEYDNPYDFLNEFYLWNQYDIGFYDGETDWYNKL